MNSNESNNTGPADEPPMVTNTHSFPRQIAIEHGVTAAILLSFIAHQVNHHKNNRNGKRWYYATIQEIQKNYPYLSTSGVAGVLKRLEEHGLIETGNFNAIPYDRTVWYSVSEEIQADVKKHLIKLDVGIATSLDITEAVLIHNLRYWTKKKATEANPTPGIAMSPTKLARLLPFSVSVIKRALKRLTKEKLIAPVPDQPGHYSLTEQGAMTGPKVDSPARDGELVNGAKLYRFGSGLHGIGSKLDKIGSKLDNNTYYKPLESVSNSLENTPAAPEPVLNPDPPLVPEQQKHNTVTDSIHPPTPIPSDPGKGQDQDQTPPEPTQDPIQVEETPTPQITYKECLGFVESSGDDFDLDHCEAITGYLLDLCYYFIHKLPIDELLSLQSIGKHDDLLQALQPYASTHLQPPFLKYMKNKKELHEEHITAYMFHCLHILVEAFLMSKDEKYRTIPPTDLYPVCIYQDVRLVIHRRVSQHSGELRQQERQAFIEKHASPTRDREHFSGLSAAEKLHALRNALISRNKIGWVHHTGLKTDIIYFPKAALQTARRLFELNPDLPVSTLLQIIERCVGIYLEGPLQEGYKPFFHARKGRNLNYLLTHLQEILRELDMAADSIQHFLPKEGTKEENPE